MPVNVCPDVPLTFYLAGADVEFVDIDPETLCIDTKECLRRLSLDGSKYSGIIYVRTYGRLTDISHFVSHCKTINSALLIIDDRCLCIPVRNPDMNNADMVLYSTGHCKQIDLWGGGVAFYRHREPYGENEQLFYNGLDEEIIYKEAFMRNEKISAIPVGWLKLDKNSYGSDYFSVIESKISARLAIRNELNYIYSSNLPKEIQLDSSFNEWRFNIKVPVSLKAAILQALFDNGLFASSHYHSVNRLFDNDTYINSDRFFDRIINLFNDANFTKTKAELACRIITSFPILNS